MKVPPTLIVDVNGCARCDGDGHDALLFMRLENPMIEKDEVIANMWALCPNTREPIMLLLAPDE